LTASDALSVENLSYAYGAKKALDGVSFTVRRGARNLGSVLTFQHIRGNGGATR